MSDDREEIRHRLEFKIRQAYCMEKLTETFFGRLDRIFTYLTVLSGTSAFVFVRQNSWLLLIFVAISTARIVYRFGDTSRQAASQKGRYQVLMNQMDFIEDDQELTNEFLKLMDRNTSELGVFKDIAYNQTCYMTGLQSGCEPLSKYASFMAWFTGAPPCHPPKQSDS